MSKELTDQEKARAVLCRSGRAGNDVAGMVDEEIAELAVIYEQCVAPEQELRGRVNEFWAGRAERLAALKAAVDPGPQQPAPKTVRPKRRGKGSAASQKASAAQTGGEAASK